MKTLKLFNGRFGHGDHAYIAARSRAEASRISGLSGSELKNYFANCWGLSATKTLGMPTEPCFWVHREKKKLYERLDKQEPVVFEGSRRGLGIKITRFQDVPQFTREGSWECDIPFKNVWRTIDEWRVEQALDIDPDFQRTHVWTEAQQIAWIEYFLRGGKTGRVLYLNNPSWNIRATRKVYNDFVLIDGKQRLEAIRRFLHDEIRVFGSRYSEFADTLSMTQTIKLNVNDLQTRKEVLQFYIDFNSTGTPHSAEEINRVRDLLAAA